MLINKTLIPEGEEYVGGFFKVLKTLNNSNVYNKKPPMALQMNIQLS